MPVVTPTRLRAVEDLSSAAALFGELGFRGSTVPVDARELGLGDGLENNLAVRSGNRRSRGFGLFFTELSERPRTLKALGRRLVERFHDRPVAIVGVRPPGSAGWERFIVVRPRTVRGVLRAVHVAKLEVDISSPTQHDAEVLSSIAWHGDDATAHDRIDLGMDADRVTARFYRELSEHYQRLIEALRAACDSDVAVLDAIKSSVGPGDDPIERVSLRILTQLLFCWFLQRKGLLADEEDYLRTRFRGRSGQFYASELETLFYDVLACPVERRRAGLPGVEIPFLNGGLFERTYGDISLPLPDSIFDLEDGLLGFLSRWTFTVAEDVPDESEVAVDPEMLGKVFENLISDDQAKRQGTVYTPRPVVHFMCREALVPYLIDRLRLGEEWSRTLLVDDDALDAYLSDTDSERTRSLAKGIDDACSLVRVLDPAVGSGAFLLGMLAEVVRLRSMAWQTLRGRPPAPDQIVSWKLHAIERTLFGVDVNPVAIELCRLRLWLSLVVDLPSGETPQPLPNLEHRTVVANSLTDFVNGIQVQNTREGRGGLEFEELDSRIILELRHQYFSANDPDLKETLAEELAEAEDALIGSIFDSARNYGEKGTEAQENLTQLAERFRSWDREFPLYVPSFHSPDVWHEGGFDVTIMNPPYLSRKEARQHLDSMRLADYERHFDGLNDLMILFARRARQLTRANGVVSMIFNDSLFTNADAEELRCNLFDRDRVLVCARTKCFEGKAIIGGVVVSQVGHPHPAPALRWVEGYRRPTSDFASASDPLRFSGKAGAKTSAGQMEVFSAPANVYRVLPHRPLFRPSAEAIKLLDRFTDLQRWDTVGTREGWSQLSNTRALETQIETLRRTGWYDSLTPGQWVLLGYVIGGGQGLATADEKHFIGAVEGTEAAAEHLANQERLEALLKTSDKLWATYEKLRKRSSDREGALLALWGDLDNDAELSRLWPKGALFRVAKAADVRKGKLTVEEKSDGVARGPAWVPFEKGDESQEIESSDGRASRIGARWARRNPLVIDWGAESVRLLRTRASGRSTRRRPRIQNEDNWFTEGITWNNVTSYLRARRVSSDAIFGHKAPTIWPSASWLTPTALLALLNSDTADFIVRTFLGSRMQIEVGDIRRIPVPVLSREQTEALTELASRATDAKLAADERRPSKLAEVEHELNVYVRDLYGVPRDAELWVVR